MPFIKRVPLFLLLLAALWPAVAASAPAPSAPPGPEPGYLEAKKALDAEDFLTAVERLDALIERHPDSPFAQRARLDLAYAYYRLGDYSRARIEAEQFITSNPDHPQLPFAYYVAGLTHYTTALKLLSSEKGGAERAAESGEQALRYFGLLTERFPKSQYSDHARLRSAYLLERLTRRQHALGTIHPLASAGTPFDGVEGPMREAWILEQRPDYYTVQLLSSPDPDQIGRIIEEHGLARQAMIYPIARHNGTIHTLLYGLFESEKEAMDVGARLPREILDIQPTIRRLGEIQAQIRGERTPPKRTPEPRQAARAEEETTAPATGEEETPRLRHGELANAWLLAQNPRHFTLQLAGMRREKSVKRFIADHPGVEPIGYYHGLREGRSWYAVVTGLYPTLDEAKQAAAEIQARLGIERPWIRRIRAIQKSIRALRNHNQNSERNTPRP